MAEKMRINNNNLSVFFQNSPKMIPIADAGFLFGTILRAKMDTTTLKSRDYPPRLREVESHPASHSMWRSWDPNPGILAPGPMLLLYTTSEKNFQYLNNKVQTSCS